jgi:SNF2 family DNA or RNA helicase
MPGMVLKWLRQDEFAEKVATTTLYAKTTDVLDLPEVMHHQIDVTLTPKEAKLYRDLESDLCAACDDGTVTPANALVHLLRLQQITGGWIKPDEQPARQIDETPSKASAIADLIADLPEDEPIVIFCRFKSDIRSCKAICEPRGVSELSGDANELADWQDGKTNVLVAQIQSGGIGIDLTRAAYCIFASLGYSLAEYEQALARLHRPGQERTTHFYHLVAENTVDQDVYAALRERKEVIESVLNKYTQGQTHERTASVGADR